MKSKKYVYSFEEADWKDKKMFGGKGAGLAQMTQLGLPVSPGFVITTEACRDFYKPKKEELDELIEELKRNPPPKVRDEIIARIWKIIDSLNLPEGLMDQVRKYMRYLEEKTGRGFGDPKNPLLVSVRSGAPVSMPGMMDTVLNLGLNDETVLGLAQQTANARFAYDSYRRFLQMFGRIVLGIPDERFDKAFEDIKKKYGAEKDIDVPVTGLKELVKIYKNIIIEEKGGFPEDPWRQLEMAIKAVFRSWMNPRAIFYRIANNITPDIADATAVNVQVMVFGNMGFDSGTGVVFSRNPANGENELYGEFLPNAQGEDVVAGVRTPMAISELKDAFPELYKLLYDKVKLLERINKEVQDVEFTVERGKLYFLQTRAAKMTPVARVKTAVEMAKEGVISREEAILKVKPEHVLQLLYPRIDPKAKVEPIAKGLPASPGAVSGQVVFHPDDAVEWARNGKKVILVREETKPDDVHGFYAAIGILTSRGGMTCFSGDTLVLTNKGFMTMEEIFNNFRGDEELYVLSFDYKTMRTTWRKIIAVGKRRDKGIRISISQTGKVKDNTLDLTPSHKMYTFKGRELIKKEISKILKDNEMVIAIDKIRWPFTREDKKLAYLVGSILSNGHLKIDKGKTKPRRGAVYFTQKPNSERIEFNSVREYFKDTFNVSFNIERTKQNVGVICGETVRGSSIDLISTKLRPAVILKQITMNLTTWLLSLGEESLLSFIAGLADGDGTFQNNRIQIYVSKREIIEGLVIACLKLGIMPQITKNRNIYNVQIVERVKDILKHTKRLKGTPKNRVYGTKLFSARQLLSDIVDALSWRGKIRTYVERNSLIDAKKVRKRILPLLKDKETKKKLEKIIESDLRMLRVTKLNELGEIEVYNIEVESTNEMDKNYIVFTKNYTPILVSNSHAAVVARGIGKTAVVGAETLHVDHEKKMFKVGDIVVKEGDWITIDGTTGNIYLGQVPTVAPEIIPELSELMKWADEVRRLGVRANADVPEDAQIAKKYGAEGIGLLRIERMFRAPERLEILRNVILSESKEERLKHLERLIPLVKNDFKKMLKIMDGLPVTIRLIDPPLHEFLPDPEELLVQIYELKLKGGNEEEINKLESLYKRVKMLQEANPMMGHRGVRVGVTYPEIYYALAKAMLEATAELILEGRNPRLQIMIPQVSEAREIRYVKEKAILPAAREVEEKYKVKIPFKVGTMIETVRACLTADEIAKEVDFFSFGTNDLTQGTYTFSRDDVENKFIPQYLELGILDANPFETLDVKGVGKLIDIAVKLGKEINPDLEIGICGEHGGDPASIEFCHKVGLTYVSASPFRVMIARLAAAHAAIKWKHK